MNSTKSRFPLPFAALLPLVSFANASAYYDPGPQRWLNRDPIAEMGGVNLYLFVGHMPLSSFDAHGLALTPLTPDVGNCYSYACNKGDKTGSKGPFFPGHGSTDKDPPWEYDCKELIKQLKIDHPEAKDPDAKGNCGAGLGKIALFVEPKGDFHFHRQEDDGSWTEKCGFREPPQKHTGPPDKNPAYPTFCGYKCISNGSGVPAKP